MTNELMTRMNTAMEKLGGALGILELPEQVREIIANCPDYEARVKMLELCVKQMGK